MDASIVGVSIVSPSPYPSSTLQKKTYVQLLYYAGCDLPGGLGEIFPLLVYMSLPVLIIFYHQWGQNLSPS